MVKMISVEVDCVNDFFPPEGTLPIPGFDEAKETLGRYAEMVDDAGMVRVAVRDTHFSSDAELQQNGGPWPNHAMAGTEGAEVIHEMDFADWAAVVPNKTAEGEKTPDWPYIAWCISETLEKGGRYISIEKQDYDMFSNPFAEPLLQLMGVEEAVVCGGATEICVLKAVLSMQGIGIQCFVVKEAIAGLDEENITQAIESMANAGAIFISLEDLEGMLK